MAAARGGRGCASRRSPGGSTPTTRPRLAVSCAATWGERRRAGRGRSAARGPDRAPRRATATRAPTAGAGWATLAAARTAPRPAIVLLGPSHRVPVGGPGVGVSSAAAWRTPLGDVPLDASGGRRPGRRGPRRGGRRRPRPRAQPRGPPAVPARGARPGAGRAARHRGGARPRPRPPRCAELWDGDEHGRGGVVRPEPLPARAPRPGPATTAPSAAVVEGRVDDIGPEDACGRIADRRAAAGRPLARDRPVARSPWPRPPTRRATPTAWSATPASPSRRRRRSPTPSGPGWSSGHAPRVATRSGTGEPDPARRRRGPGRGSGCSGASFVTLRRGGAAAGVHRLARGGPAAVAATSCTTPGPRRSTTRASPPLDARRPVRPRRQGVGAVRHRAAAGRARRPGRRRCGPASTACSSRPAGGGATFLPSVWEALPSTDALPRPPC